jgi:hypothetical protein
VRFLLLVSNVRLCRGRTYLTSMADHWPQLRWRDVYREAELYKAAVRVFTKPLFHWRKALFTSSDGRTLYDLAARGLACLDTVHRALKHEQFAFRPAIALHYRFNDKHRTLYIYPWEERMVDLLLYRVLTRKLQNWFSPNSYAYRERMYGLDRCQSRIGEWFRRNEKPVYAIKRDISNYFASVGHELLLQKLAALVDPQDYLYHLLKHRVQFAYKDEDGAHRATIGIPFGTAVACCFANIYLTEMDRRIEQVSNVSYFRYADDILLLSHQAERACEARERLDSAIQELRLTLKPSQHIDLVIGRVTEPPGFTSGSEIRHLGLLFKESGTISLSRDKCRKIQNLFRYAFRRGRRRWRKVQEPLARAAILVEIALETIEKGVRNVAIVDYYLKHVNDELRLRLLDRWLAEEVLSLVLGGHRKSHFRRISFAQLRALGLPSLVHRRRMILNGRIESPFFIWQREKATRAFQGTVVRP